MKFFGKDLDEIKNKIRTPDPFREEIKNWESKELPVNVSTVVSKSSTYSDKSGLKEIDFRPIKGFGDHFPPEVYEGIRDRFPTLYDDLATQSKKMRVLMDKWVPQSEVNYTRYGQVGLAFLAAATGTYITHHFRRVLNLEHKARLSMYIGAMYFPALFCGGLNAMAINMRPLRGQECTICNGLLSGTIQSLIATIHPTAYAAVSGLYFAQRYWTVSVLPHGFLTNKPGRRQALKVTRAILLKRGGIKVFGLLFVVNFVVGYYVGVKESEETINMYYHVLKDEYQKQQTMKQKTMFDKANRNAATVGQVIDPSNVMIESS